MSSISSISQNYYSQISSGKSILRTADGPAESAVIQRGKSQIAGYQAGTRNAQDGQSVLNISDAALSSIGDQLSRMRELAVKASNSATLSDGDRKIIQGEIEQLKQGISDIASNTQFNTKNLLDGSNHGMHIATGSDGSGMSLDTGNATLEALGIADFDVTGKFSIKTIDKAIQKVSENRSSIGAQSNALGYAIGYNTNTAYQLTSAVGRMEDTDIAEMVTELKKNQVLQTYRFMMQKKQSEMEQKKLSMFYM